MNEYAIFVVHVSGRLHVSCLYFVLNSSFTDIPLIRLPPETGGGPPEVAPGHNTGYSYAHAHIEQIKNAR